MQSIPIIAYEFYCSCVIYPSKRFSNPLKRNQVNLILARYQINKQLNIMNNFRKKNLNSLISNKNSVTSQLGLVRAQV